MATIKRSDSVIEAIGKDIGHKIGSTIRSELGFRNPANIVRSTINSSYTLSHIFNNGPSTYHRPSGYVSSSDASQQIDRLPDLDYTHFQAVPVTTGDAVFDHYMTETRQQMVEGLNKVQDTMETGFNFLYRQIQTSYSSGRRFEHKTETLQKKTDNLQDSVDRLIRKQNQSDTKAERVFATDRNEDAKKVEDKSGSHDWLTWFALMPPQMKGALIGALGGLAAALVAGGYALSKIDKETWKNVLNFATDPRKYLTTEYPWMKRLIDNKELVDDFQKLIKDPQKYFEDSMPFVKFFEDGYKKHFLGAARRRDLEEDFWRLVKDPQKYVDDAEKQIKDQVQDVWKKFNDPNEMDQLLNKILPGWLQKNRDQVRSMIYPSEETRQKQSDFRSKYPRGFGKRFIPPVTPELQEQIDEGNKANEEFIKERQNMHLKDLYRQQQQNGGIKKYLGGFGLFGKKQDKNSLEDAIGLNDIGPLPRELTSEALEKILLYGHESIELKTNREVKIKTSILDLSFEQLILSYAAQREFSKYLGGGGTVASGPGGFSNYQNLSNRVGQIGQPSGRFGPPIASANQFVGGSLPSAYVSQGISQNQNPSWDSGAFNSGGSFGSIQPGGFWGMDSGQAYAAPTNLQRNIRRNTGGIGNQPQAYDPSLRSSSVIDRGRIRANYFRGSFDKNDLVKVQTSAGPMTVHKDAANDMKNFVDDLVEAGAPIKNIGAYNHRNIAGTGRLSQHAYGGAMDIEQHARDIVSPAFRSWANQNADKLNDIAERHNMISGGKWNNPDFGHFEWGGPNWGRTKDKEEQQQQQKIQNNFVQSQKKSSLSSGPSSSEFSNALQQDRARFNPEVGDRNFRDRLIAMAKAEDQNSGPGIFESIGNRASMRHQSLDTALGPRFYGSMRGKNNDFDRYLKTLDDSDRKKWDPVIDQFMKGSNVSNYATDQGMKNEHHGQATWQIGPKSDFYSRLSGTDKWIESVNNNFKKANVARQASGGLPGLPDYPPQLFGMEEFGSKGRFPSSRPDWSLPQGDVNSELSSVKKPYQSPDPFDSAKPMEIRPDPMNAQVLNKGDAGDAFSQKSQMMDEKMSEGFHEEKQKDDSKKEDSDEKETKEDKSSERQGTDARSEGHQKSESQHMRTPTHNPENEGPTPGSDGYGDEKSYPDGGFICSL